uniref:Fucolectin tachylectin-4 pentraxin-1 domain-containing protein n=1 Tax=Gouania willdenowi TaxID=441366 RepID=A0A8C5EBK9_GOUWI
VEILCIFLFLLCLGANIALGGKVSQSSQYGGAGPQKAVDGNRANNWRDKSCAHTRKNRDPWWRLDLEQAYSISTVTITNRRDCCPERLNGLNITTVGGTESLAHKWGPLPCMCHGGPIFQMTTPLLNQVATSTWVIPGRAEYLTLCEVEVFGTLADQDDDDEVKCEGM